MAAVARILIDAPQYTADTLAGNDIYWIVEGNPPRIRRGQVNGNNIVDGEENISVANFLANPLFNRSQRVLEEAYNLLHQPNVLSIINAFIKASRNQAMIEEFVALYNQIMTMTTLDAVTDDQTRQIVIMGDRLAIFQRLEGVPPAQRLRVLQLLEQRMNEMDTEGGRRRMSRCRKSRRRKSRRRKSRR